MAARKIELTDMHVSLLKAMVNKEIKRVSSLPTGEKRDTEIRLSEKVVWLAELDAIIQTLDNPDPINPAKGL